jgi:hypothetical protein
LLKLSGKTASFIFFHPTDTYPRFHFHQTRIEFVRHHKLQTGDVLKGAMMMFLLYFIFAVACEKRPYNVPVQSTKAIKPKKASIAANELANRPTG